MWVENKGCFCLMQGKSSANIEVTSLACLNDVSIIPCSPKSTSKIDIDFE